jgi:hypothetical protein
LKSDIRSESIFPRSSSSLSEMDHENQKGHELSGSGNTGILCDESIRDKNDGIVKISQPYFHNDLVQKSSESVTYFRTPGLWVADVCN